MAKARCPKCERRVGKRPCPVLDAKICERCCGSLRGVEIACTSDCPVFRRADLDHKRRQIEKAKRLDGQRQPITSLADRLERFQLELERMICSRNRSFNDVTDHEIMAVAQDALAAVEADPEAQPTPPDEPTLEDTFVGVLRQGPHCLRGVTPDERKQAVDGLVRSVKPYAAEGGGSRNYVAFLSNTVDEEYGAWRTSDEVLAAVRHLRANRPMAAVDILERERDLRPNDASLQQLLSQAYGRSGRHEEAFEAIQKAVEINPDNVDFLESMVVAASETGRYCAAWNVAGKALELSPAPAARTRLRDMHTRLGKAIQQQLAGREHLDMGKLAQFERATFAGLGAMRQGNMPLAETRMEEAVGIDPQCADTRSLLGQVYMQTNRAEEAKQAFAAALRLNPKHEMARMGLEAAGAAAGDGGPQPKEEGGGRIITP